MSLDNEFPIRTQDYIDEVTNCALCSRTLKRIESHWHCIVCRKWKAEAKCPINCRACIALFEDKWRYSALSKSDKESLKKKLYLSKLDISDCSKISCETKTLTNVTIIDVKDFDNKDKVNLKESLMKSKGVKRKGVAKGLGPKSSKKKVKHDDFKEEDTVKMLDDPFMRRLKEFETFLYQDLVIELPADLVCDGFEMPEVPTLLILKFNVTKNELIRLIATASISYHLSKNLDQISVDRNIRMLGVSNVDAEFIGVELYASLIKFKANTLAKVIFQIRESILSKVYCKDESLIPKLIRGPINPAISFFGNLDALQEAVKKDKKNQLTTIQIEK